MYIWRKTWTLYDVWPRSHFCVKQPLLVDVSNVTFLLRNYYFWRHHPVCRTVTLRFARLCRAERHLNTLRTQIWPGTGKFIIVAHWIVRAPCCRWLRNDRPLRRCEDGQTSMKSIGRRTTEWQGTSRVCLCGALRQLRLILDVAVQPTRLTL